MCSPLNGFLLIVPLQATRDKWRLRFWLCGVQFDSAVWCTPQNLLKNFEHLTQNNSKKSVFVFSYLLRFSSTFYRKTFEIKKIAETILLYYFHSFISRHHREITIVKIQINLLTPHCKEHGRAWFCGGKRHTMKFLRYYFSWLSGAIHTTESDSAV